MQKLVMHAVFQALLQLAKIVMSVEVGAWGVVWEEGLVKGLAKGAGKGCYEGVCCLTAVCGYDVGVGSMAERPNALVLKTSEGHTSGGSNPSTSADETLGRFSTGGFFISLKSWRMCSGPRRIVGPYVTAVLRALLHSLRPQV